MYITIGDCRFDFQKVDIEVLEKGIENTFAKFNKMTIRQLLTQKKYVHLAKTVEAHYDWLLDKPAGTAVLELKMMGDLFYKHFLNNYGDLCFTRFIVQGKEAFLQKNGVYNIIVDNELVFTGVCARSFKERFNQHIGNVSAKGCFKDGTATHCHINARLTEIIHQRKVHFYIYPMKDKQEMIQLKNAIVRRFEPVWNLRAGNKSTTLSSY